MDKPHSLEIPGPEDAYLLIEPRPHCYQWRIRNDSLRHLNGLRLEIIQARSFNATKAAFRDPTEFNVQWGPILELASGHLSEPKIFVRFDGDKFGFDNSTGGHLLDWPTGDPSTAQRWLLTMRIRGLAKEWPIELDLRWTLGTNTLELTEHPPARGEEPGSPLHDSNLHLATDSFTFFKEPGPVGDNPCPPIDDGNVWLKYRARFEANLESLEAMAARSDPLHLPLDEQDAQRFARNAAKQRFDELAEVDYRQWVASGLPHETFARRLAELRAQVLTAFAELWSLRSNILRQWYQKNCQLPAEGELDGKVSRWEQRARTAELVRHLSRDDGRGLIGQIEELAKLIAEEDQKVPGSEDRLRLSVQLYDVGHRFSGGYSGDFLERSRRAVADVGFQLGPPSGLSPLEFCLRMLFHELVCEREPLRNPEIARLNSDQVERYLSAPYSGSSITPDSGEVRNPCEALRWYCQRLIGLIDSPDVVLRINRRLPKIPAQESRAGKNGGRRRGRRRNQDRRDAICKAIAKHGDAWRDHLSDIFAELDANEVPLGDFQGREIDLGEGQNAKVWKWTDLDLAQGDQLKQIVDALRKYTD